MNVSKPILTDKLKAELVAAGVTVNAVVFVVGSDQQQQLYLTDNDGRWVEPSGNALPVIAAHDGTPPVPVDYGTDALDQRDKVAQLIQNINQYQSFTAAAVTSAQRKQYEDMIGNAVKALAKRVIGL